ncbi:MAG: PIN domain-containing protein [Acidobacteriia bacterium]|nr:PIN domain-containing protein [Terriglobia bacterium]
MRFVDTKVLLYSLDTTAQHSRKAAVARTLLGSDDLAMSTQVLQEFYVQATRVTRSGAITHEQAVTLLKAFLRFPVQEITVRVLQSALVAKQKFGLSYWDAAVVEAARALGCGIILTEDWRT